MSRFPVASALFAGLSALSALAMAEHGYVAIFERALVDSAAWQLGFDLVCALTLVSFWMAEDAKRRGLSVWPWLAAIPFLGSLSPLAYVIYARFAARASTGELAAA